LIERVKNAVREMNSNIFITPVQVAEIYSGMRPKEKLRIETFIESLNIIDINRRMGKLAGEFLHDYGKAHSVTIAVAIVGAAEKPPNIFTQITLNNS
jgi:predicted nucleic acid-binding protein